VKPVRDRPVLHVHPGQENINTEIMIEKGIVAPVHSMKAYRGSRSVAQNID